MRFMKIAFLAGEDMALMIPLIIMNFNVGR